MTVDGEIIGAIQSVGFPIVVAVFVLWRLDRKLGELTIAITAMHATLVEYLRLTGYDRRLKKEEPDRGPA